MRVNVPGTEFLGEEFCQRLLRGGAAEVNHDGDTGDRARLEGPVDCNKISAHVVCRLDPHDQPLVAKRHLRRRLCLHVLDILLGRYPAHPGAHDVEEREDAGPRTIDDACLEFLEVPPAGASGIGHAGHSRAQGETVGVDAVITGIRPPLARPGEDMNVDIDQPRCHKESCDLNGLQRQSRINFGSDGGDVAAVDGHVTNRAGLVPGIDDMAPAEQEIVRLLRAGTGHQKKEDATSQEFHGVPRIGWRHVSLEFELAFSPGLPGRSIVVAARRAVIRRR